MLRGTNVVATNGELATVAVAESEAENRYRSRWVEGEHAKTRDGAPLDIVATSVE